MTTGRTLGLDAQGLRATRATQNIQMRCARQLMDEYVMDTFSRFVSQIPRSTRLLYILFACIMLCGTLSVFGSVVAPSQVSAQHNATTAQSRHMRLPTQRLPNGSLRVIKTLVLDPGHGGGNEGAQSAAENLEKEEVLRVAYAVRAKLKETWPDLRVVLTRSLDVDVDLVDRIQAANRIQADLFLSIHMNSSVNTNANGFEVFYLRADKSMPLVTSGKGTWGKHYADAEKNEKDVSPKTPSYGASGEALAILFSDLDQGRVHRDSASLAETLLAEMKTSFPTRRSRGVRQANFGVLRGAAVPAVVVELGFLSHKEEERWLRKPSTHRQFADAIVRTVRRMDASYVKSRYHETAAITPP